MSYQIKLDTFEGPLDLLLHLIEKEEMDILISKRIEDQASKSFNEVIKKRKIIDKSAYMNAILKKIDRADIEAEIRLERWLDYTKKDLRPNTDLSLIHISEPTRPY